MSLINKETRLLVLAAHVDDELNCAGTIARVVEAGGQALVVAGSPCYASVRAKDNAAGHDIAAEFRASCAVLGAEHVLWDYRVRSFDEVRQAILDGFIGWRKDFEPTMVFSPSETDLHQDHGVYFAEAMRACRNTPLLWGWESPNNQRKARIDAFVTLERQHVDLKVRAWEQYRTQHHRDYFDEGMIRSMAEMRGKQCRVATKLAEAFQNLSIIL